jgi:hypothetical protein
MPAVHTSGWQQWPPLHDCPPGQVGQPGPPPHSGQAVQVVPLQKVPAAQLLVHPATPHDVAGHATHAPTTQWLPAEHPQLGLHAPAGRLPQVSQAPLLQYSAARQLAVQPGRLLPHCGQPAHTPLLHPCPAGQGQLALHVPAASDEHVLQVPALQKFPAGQLLVHPAAVLPHCGQVVHVVPLQNSPARQLLAQPAMPQLWGGQAWQVPLTQWFPAAQEGQPVVPHAGAAGHVVQVVPLQNSPARQLAVQPAMPQLCGGQAWQVPLTQWLPDGHAAQPVVPQAGSGGQALHTLPLHVCPDGQVPQVTDVPQLLVKVPQFRPSARHAGGAEHTLATPPAPHTRGEVQLPQLTVPPQPLLTVPQLRPRGAHAVAAVRQGLARGPHVWLSVSQTSLAAHVPQLSVVPHPSETDPQVAPWSSQVMGTQARHW